MHMPDSDLSFHKALLRISWCLLACTLLAACTFVTITLSFPVEDQFITATPLPTIDAFDGISTIPEEQFLFVSVTGSLGYSSSCDLPPMAAMQEPFNFYGGEALELNWSMYRGAPITQSWAEIRAENGAIGLFTFYELTGGRLEIFSALPFTPPGENFIVNGVDENGSIAVKVSYGLTYIEPGKNIALQAVRPAEGFCQIRYTTRLANFGFIRDEQVTLR